MLEGDDGGSSDDHKGPRAEEGPSKASLLTRSEGSVLESDLGAAFDEGTWTSADHTPDSVGSRERALLKAGQLSAFVKQFGEEQRLDRGIDALDRYVAHPVTESQLPSISPGTVAQREPPGCSLRAGRGQALSTSMQAWTCTLKPHS